LLQTGFLSLSFIDNSGINAGLLFLRYFSLVGKVTKSTRGLRPSTGEAPEQICQYARTKVLAY
jgi:hypothetical protein